MRFAVRLFLEKSVSLAAEIALHSLGNVVIALKAAFADARADGRADILRSCAERAHFFDRRTEDVLHAALPAAVHRRNDLSLGIVQQNRHAVGNIDHDRQILYVCHKPVALDALIRADRVSVGIAGKVNEPAVNLLCDNEVVLSAAHDLAGEAVVFADGGVIVAAVHAKVPRGENALAHAADARCEHMLCAYFIRCHVYAAVLHVFSKCHYASSSVVSAAALLVLESA